MDKCGLIDQPRLTENDLQISPGKKIRPTRHWSRITFCPLSAFSFSAFQLSRRVVVPQPRDEGGSTPQRLNFSFQLSCRAVVLARRRISLSAFQLFGSMVHEEFGLRQALGRHVTASSQLACPACHLSLVTGHWSLATFLPFQPVSFSVFQFSLLCFINSELTLSVNA